MDLAAREATAILSDNGLKVYSTRSIDGQKNSICGGGQHDFET